MQESNYIGKICLVIAYKKYIFTGQVLQVFRTFYFDFVENGKITIYSKKIKP